MRKIAIIPGDGIGIEVTRAALRVLECAKAKFDLSLTFTEFDWGAEKYLREGVSLPAGAVEMFEQEYAAIFTGAFGDPRVPDNRHAADILLGLRFKLDLYINLRPVVLLADRLTPLKNRTRTDLDFVIFRENTEGLYVNAGGVLKRGTPQEVAIQEEINTRHGVERIIVAAFEYARQHGRQRVTLADKSNLLTYGHDLWRRTFREVASRFPEIEANAQYIDAMAMLMITNPEQYQVIVTNNLFGDILTDLGAGLVGGLGLAASGNIHPGKVSLFEPVHGSAPNIAGKDMANPIGAILTAAMMLEYLGHPEAAQAVESAVSACIAANQVTSDIGGTLGTQAAGEAVVARM
ncbi:MAG: 3-isopropylmalate dehydrogenase [Blastocatellia bacterium]|nr:3-isopropylmalate dehydrogenase [Blastocatellia bacterium]